jgi:tetratricopeptide (TPR) repeat protein
MGKFLVFYLIWRITGNPILAIIVLLVIYYFVDRRYIGLLPSISKPFRRRSRMAQLRRMIHVNPHDMPAKQDLAELYIDTRQYRRALELLHSLPKHALESPSVLYDLGQCQLALGDVAQGEALITQALQTDARLSHGEPYLKLAAAVAQSNPERSMEYLSRFQQQNVSTCESYYRIGLLQQQFGHADAALRAWRDCLDTYRSLPRFRKRTQRRWVIKALFRSMGGRSALKNGSR